MSLESISRLHTWQLDDYNVAKANIHQALGNLDDIEIFGDQVLVAVYVRADRKELPNPNGGPKRVMYTTMTDLKEDVWQGKVVLILKMGPDAFRGDASYQKAVFGDQLPVAEGDWVFVRSSDGVQINLFGEGAKKVMAEQHDGTTVPVWDWNGWPCRVIRADSIIGRITKPHSIV